MVKKYIEMYKEEIKKSVKELMNKDTFHKQVPNLLTFIRLVGGIPAGLIYSLNPYVSIGAIVLLWFTDAIDGRIATKFNCKSKLGADMDAFADKIMFLGSSIPLLINTPGLILNFILEGVISLINVTGRVKGLDTKTVLSGKIKTVLLALTLVSGYFVQFLGMPVIVFNLLRGFTTGYQFIAIKDYIIEFIRMDNELKDNILSGEVNQNNTKNIEESEDKELTPTVGIDLTDELKQERDLALGFLEPDRDYAPKARKRIYGKYERHS